MVTKAWALRFVVLSFLVSVLTGVGCDDLGQDTCTVDIDVGAAGGDGAGGAGSDSDLGGAGGGADACMVSILKFDADAFKFVTVIADDDPTLPAGGWQEALTILKISTIKNPPTFYQCPVHIGMPQRAEAWGVISADTAALYSANVANAATDTLRKSTLPPGIFCSKLKDEMKTEFKMQYPGLGARMQGS